jgi:hypothetical protein
MSNLGRKLQSRQAGKVEGRSIYQDIEVVIKGFEVFQVAGVIAQDPVVIRSGAPLHWSSQEGSCHPHPEKPAEIQRFQKKALFLSNPVFLGKIGQRFPLGKGDFFILLLKCYEC